MVKKYCPKCKSYSYSAYSEREWICPSCGYDLRDEPVLDIDERSSEDEEIEEEVKNLPQ